MCRGLGFRGLGLRLVAAAAAAAAAAADVGSCGGGFIHDTPQPL